MPKGNRGESCPIAIRAIFQQDAGPHRYSKVKAILREKGAWKDSTIRRMIMSVIVNLPPAREEWATKPFLFIGQDGRLEMHDEDKHGKTLD